MPLSPYGKRVRKYRIDRMMRLNDHAQAVGMTPSYLSATENNGPFGSHKRPSLKLVQKTAELFELDEAAAQELMLLAGYGAVTREELLERIAERTRLMLDVGNHRYHQKHPDYQFLAVTCGHNISWSRRDLVPDKCHTCLKQDVLALLSQLEELPRVQP